MSGKNRGRGWGGGEEDREEGEKGREDGCVDGVGRKEKEGKGRERKRECGWSGAGGVGRKEEGRAEKRVDEEMGGRMSVWIKWRRRGWGGVIR